MTIFTVTTAADAVDAGDGVLSLREAVSQANATAAADTIRFAAAVEGRTLTLTGGQLALDADLTIDGDRDGDGTRVTLDGNQSGRVLAIGGGGTDVALADLAVTGGRIVNSENGGGILLGAGNALAMERCTVRGNQANYGGYDSGDGGGIFARADSRLSISDSIVSNNGGALGGGIAVTDGSTLLLTRSAVLDNFSSGRGFAGGGGLYLRDSVTEITDSSIVGNETSAGPTGVSGGGMLVEGGALDVRSSTVTGNRAEGIYTYNPGGGISVSVGTDFAIANSIVLGNSRTDDNGITNGSEVSGTVDHSNGHNIFGSYVTGAPGDRFSSPADVFATIDPATGGGRAAFNGGPTPSVALVDSRSNPALSGGEPTIAGDGDQRGVARPLPAASSPDIGAFELGQSRLSTTSTFQNDVLTGTNAADRLSGSYGSDTVLGLGGNDRLSGGGDGDTLRGGIGDDVLDGGAGRDTASYLDAGGAVIVSLAAGAASGAAGRDTLFRIENIEGGSGADLLTGDGTANSLGGRQGADRLFGLTGDDWLLGGEGDDLLEPGFGDDRLRGGGGNDKLSYFNDGGPLAVTVDLARGTATRSGEIDRLQGIENADGTNNADQLRGDGLANALGGAGGADRIFGRDGADVLLGALGNDRLTGELGRDTQTGGGGADLFDYDQLADSTVGANRDVITDFVHLTDRIDLSTIDARSASAANEAFLFRGPEGAAFTGAGQVRWFHDGGDTFVEASVDADRAAELQIELAGLKTLSAGDFVL